MYSIVRRFGWIRNRQYRQLRRLCCEILIHSVFTLPEPLLSASDGILFSGSAGTTACSTAAVPSGYEPCGGVDSESTTSSPFRKGYSPFNGEPNQYHGWMTLQRSLMYEDGLDNDMSGVACICSIRWMILSCRGHRTRRRPVVSGRVTVSSSQEYFSLRPILETGMIVFPPKLYKLTLPTDQRSSVMVVVQPKLWRQRIS